MGKTMLALYSFIITHILFLMTLCAIPHSKALNEETYKKGFKNPNLEDLIIKRSLAYFDEERTCIIFGISIRKVCFD